MHEIRKVPGIGRFLLIASRKLLYIIRLHYNMEDNMEGHIRHDQEICRFMADDYVSRIMHATYGRALNVQQISAFCDIPIAFAYRRVREMAETGLLICINEMAGQPGEKEKLYQCAVNRIQYIFDKGSVTCLMCLEIDPIVFQMTDEH